MSPLSTSLNRALLIVKKRFKASVAKLEMTEKLRDFVKPPVLNQGDTVALIAVSSPSTPQEVESAVTGLSDLGFRVKTASNLTEKLGGFLAGDAAVRSAEFNKMYFDPEVKALWVMKGGSGCAEILPNLDFEKIRSNPKIVIGMSDVTALHSGFSEKAGIGTFLGPNVWYLFGEETRPDHREYCVQSLLNVISNTGSKLKEGDKFLGFPYPSCLEAPRKITGGTCTGQLAGGNLRVLLSMIGTPYEMNFAGKILVLEDVREKTHRVHRMFVQLKQTGILDSVAGVVLGRFEQCDLTTADSWTVDEIINTVFNNANYPVISEFPTGHVNTQASLPLGCLARLNADTVTLELLEKAVVY